MRKTQFCICDNKDADQIHGNREADQCLCFFATRIVQSLFFEIRSFKSLAIFCGSAARFVSDQFGKSELLFSHDAAYMKKCIKE